MGTIADKLTYLNTTKSKIKDSINNLGGNITGSTTFRNYATELDSIYSKLPKVSGTGSILSLSPTLKGRLGITPKGDTYQFSTTGKNKLVTSLTTIKARNTSGTWNNNVYTYNGITFTINEDLSITIGGTYSQRAYMYISSQNFEIDPNTYILSGCPSGGSASTYLIGGDLRDGSTYISSFTDTGSSSTKDLSTYTTPKLDFYIDIRNSNAIGKTFHPMLRLSSITDNSYEPYTGGIASPNPSYSQTIQSVTGNQVVSVEGKNLFNKDGNSQNNKMYDSSGNIISDTGSRAFVDYIPVQSNANIYVSGSDYIRLCEYDKDKSFIKRTISNALNYLSLETTNETKYIRLSIVNGNENDVQIEYNSTASTYQAYQNQTQAIRLGNIKLYNGDEIQGTPNNWSIVRENGEVVLNGSEAWTTTTTSITGKYRNSINFGELTNNNYIKPATNNDVGQILSNYYTPVISNTAGTYGCHQGISLNATSSNTLYIYDDTYNTDDTTAFKTWLSTHNTKVVYKLATPTTETITDTDLIEDLNELYYAMSNDDTTNISVSGNLPMIVSVSALKGE